MFGLLKTALSADHQTERASTGSDLKNLGPDNNLEKKRTDKGQVLKCHPFVT